MKLNRKWVLAIALLLSVAVATAGTLAYLTDRDTVENTFTMGNVDIEVEEDFPEEGAPIEPGQEVNKDAKITNQGKNPAWVWMTVSVPEELKDHVTLKWANGFEPTSDSPAIVDGQAVWTVLVDEQLPAGESTKYILDSVTLSEYVDYQGGQYVVVKDGNTTTLESLEGGKFDVTVTGYATQVDEFATVAAAYDAYQGQWGEGEPDTPPQQVKLVHNEDELIAALEEGGYIKFANNIEATQTFSIDADDIVDGDSYTLLHKSTRGTVFNPTGGTIKNLTIEMEDSNRGTQWCIGSMQMLQSTLTDDLYLDHVALSTGFTVIDVDANGNSVIVTNSTLNNAVQIANAELSSFENCHFTAECAKKPFITTVNIYPLGDMSFTNCHFEESVDFYQDDTKWTGTMTFNGCTYGNNGVEDRPFEPTVGFFTWWMEPQGVVNFKGTFGEGDPARVSFTYIVDGTTVWEAQSK